MRSIIDDDLKYIENSISSWEKLRGKRILITGANGFIPAYMVETIIYLNESLKLNAKVFALVRNKEKALSRFSHLIGKIGLEFIVQDVCDPIKLIEPINFIIHAASQASPKYYGVDPIGTLTANTIGSYNILTFAEKQKELRSLLYFSSAEVYGDTSTSEEYIKENDFGSLDCMTLRACYAESKRMGETMCNSWWHQKNIPTKIIRIFHTYGPGMDLDDGRVFADFVKDIVNDKSIEIKSDGKAIRSFCYLADTVIAAFKVLLDAPNGEVYNVGNEDNQVDMNELAHILSGIVNKDSSMIKRDINEENGYLSNKVSKIIPNTEKLRSLGWGPEFSIEDGFSRTITYYKK
ncbi:dTDP-glucose 4,6-dehydratase [Leminorella grimontii]|uniref:dTDP-glucose 4,6-dehydratase n=1 Tax=Leminorella grimontii TaxID=82981 RepID=A0AAV5MZA0_9GAMM|nr:NAD-dependent epimerase/dehydratase family protein [Leminorella grimontii]KFC97637.1 dTDP-glucose 4,6-dehydratase [Leminorella grimontii ATCC 33999 = DSM 5078]GKX55000.1 dTDP-glucose 4,6-dehydratase [Leminorella grimontii]VFS57074.1 dTDP-glucose 4,6-dehydratase [Leminorella grimontii]